MRSKQQFLSVFFIIILNRWFKKIYVYLSVCLAWYWFILSLGRSAPTETIRIATDYEPLWLSFSISVWLFTEMLKSVK